MVLTAYSGLSLVTGLYCHHHQCESIITDLMPASGHQDHTASPSALARFVLRAAASTASRAQRP